MPSSSRRPAGRAVLPPAPVPVHAFVNGPIFLGEAGTWPRGLVVVEAGRITRVARRGRPPRGARVVDLAGRLLLPGLIDCHVHLCMDAGPDPAARYRATPPPMVALAAAAHARITLEAGVTTARDLGGLGHADLCLRRAVAEGLLPGPRILAAGRMICPPGGHGHALGGHEADGPAEVARAVGQEIEAGADWVKVMATGGVLTVGAEPGAAQMSPAELRAAVAAAHRAGRRVAAHAQGREGILNALLAGVDTIEHGHQLDEELVELMKRQGTCLVATLSAPLRTMAGAAEGRVPAWVAEKTRVTLDNHLASLALAHARGVPLAMGSDAGIPGDPHGGNLAELGYLHQAGLSGEEALLAATAGAARALGMGAELGAIAEGRAADLVVAAGDPLAHPGGLADPAALVLVMQGGRVVKAAPEAYA